MKLHKTNCQFLTPACASLEFHWCERCDVGPTRMQQKKKVLVVGIFPYCGQGNWTLFCCVLLHGIILVSFQKSRIRKHSISWSPPIECIRVKYVSSEITATYRRHRLEVHLFSRSFSCRTPHQFDEKSKQTD